MSPRFLKAILNGNRGEASEEIGLDLPPDWPGEDLDVLQLRLKQLETQPDLQPWLLRGMALRGTRTMVGHIGFHMAPGGQYLDSLSPGGVELGFSVFPQFRRQGYAREATLGMIDWARKAHGATRFVVSIRPDNHPSLSLAQQLGFKRIGSHIDDVDGPEDIFELKVD